MFRLRSRRATGITMMKGRRARIGNWRPMEAIQKERESSIHDYRVERGVYRERAGLRQESGQEQADTFKLSTQAATEVPCLLWIDSGWTELIVWGLGCRSKRRGAGRGSCQSWRCSDVLVRRGAWAVGYSSAGVALVLVSRRPSRKRTRKRSVGNAHEDSSCSAANSNPSEGSRQATAAVCSGRDD